MGRLCGRSFMQSAILGSAILTAWPKPIYQILISAIWDEEKNGYVARDQLLYAL